MRVKRTKLILIGSNRNYVNRMLRAVKFQSSEIQYFLASRFSSCTQGASLALAVGTVPYYASDNYYARGGHATSYLVRKVRAGCGTAKVSSVDEIARVARRASCEGLTGDFGVGRVEPNIHAGLSKGEPQ